MDVGPFIKLQRMKQNIRQEELAKGVISESYLSKIENQKTTPSSRVTKILLSRLGVKLEDKENDSILVKKCEDWFSLLFSYTDQEEIITRYNELQELVGHSFTEVNTLFEIHKVRYFLITNQFKEASDQVDTLKELIETFNDKEYFYWKKFLGNFYSVKEDFTKALHIYKQAEKKLEQLDLSEWEKADLNYIIAVTYSKLRKTIQVIEYTKLALNYFRANYQMFRCAQSHVLLGISYKRIQVFDKAYENYYLAKDIAKKNNYPALIRLVNVNLGELHASKGETALAISYFEKIMEDKGASPTEKLTAIISLADQYYRKDKLDKKRNILEYAYTILEEMHGSNKEFFEMRIDALYLLSTGRVKEFEDILINKLILYLEKLSDYGNLVIYGSMMGHYFEKLKKYKFATKYYKIANQAYSKLIEI